MNNTGFYEELYDKDFSGLLDKKGKKAGKFSAKHIQENAKSIQNFVETQYDSPKSFKFTYKATRFEEGWLLKSLGGFYEHRWISDVLRRVKGNNR